MSGKIRVAIVGVGNCASALLQGLVHYADVDEKSPLVPGLMRNNIGGYLVRDIQVVAAFDVNANKVGRDIAEAIWVSPNNAMKFSDVPNTGVLVSPGFLGDGIAEHMLEVISVTDQQERVQEVLRESEAEILVSFLPVGSHHASRFYAHACLETGVAFINGIPEFIASDPEWSERFREAGIPCAGDDVMSQGGATILNRALLRLLIDRGFIIENSVQLNVGGNADFQNMEDASRVISKKISKVASLQYETGEFNVIAKPAAFVASYEDQKIADIRIRGKQFGGVPFELEAKLRVEDSPNSAGVMVDAIRLMKLSLDRGLSGYQAWSAYFFKHPLEQLPLPEGRKLVEEFIG